MWALGDQQGEAKSCHAPHELFLFAFLQPRVLCILLITPLPSGRQILVLMIWVDEAKAEKQTVLEFVGVLLLLLWMEGPTLSGMS